MKNIKQIFVSCSKSTTTFFLLLMANVSFASGSIDVDQKYLDVIKKSPTEEKDLLNIAKKELDSIKNSYRNDSSIVNVFSVRNPSDFLSSYVEYGFEVFTIDSKDIIDGRRELSTVTRTTGEWRFIVKQEDKVIGSITLGKSNGKWRVNEFGSINYAKDVDSKIKELAEFGRGNMRIVRIFHANSDFIEVRDPISRNVMYSPLTSANGLVSQLASESKKYKLYDGRNLLSPLRRNINISKGIN